MGAGKSQDNSRRGEQERIGHAMYIIDNKGKIENDYHIAKRRLGEGSFARVCKGFNISTGATRAVKISRKYRQRDKNDLIWYEIAIMKMLDHPNIVKIFETFEDKKFIYMVLEYCEGGELHDYVIAHSHLTEGQAVNVMYQVFRAVFYMHTSQVAHRDLKPENIMFAEDTDISEASIKIIDFGLSRVYNKGTLMTTKCGGVFYVSPQVLAGRYDQATDLWTCGVVLYILICGYPPFSGGNDAEILSRVRLGNYAFASCDWKLVSHECKDLVRGLLMMNPKERTKAKEAMRSDWVDTQKDSNHVHIGLKIIDSFKRFRSMGMLKKASLHLMAGLLDDDVIKPLRSIFVSLDWSGDGLISASEIQVGLTKSGCTQIPDDLEQLMCDIDNEGSGEIDYSEFLAATLDPIIYTEEKVCWRAFRVLDRNGEGDVSAQQLMKALNNGWTEDIVDEEMALKMIREVDETGNERISFDEFCKMMKGTVQPFIRQTARQKQKAIKMRKKKEGKLKYERAVAAAKQNRGRKSLGHELSDFFMTGQQEGMASRLSQAIRGSVAGKAAGHLTQSMRRSLSHDPRSPQARSSMRQSVRDQRAKLRASSADNMDVRQSCDRRLDKDRKGYARNQKEKDRTEEDDARANDFMQNRFIGVGITVERAKVKGPETMDLWVIVEVPGQPEKRFETPECPNTSRPQWNHSGNIVEFTPEEEIMFTVMDHPMAPPVGTAVLTWNDIFPDGKRVELKLKDNGKNTGLLLVDIEVVDLQTRAATRLQAVFRGIADRKEVLGLKNQRWEAVLAKAKGK
mmetsp:Transcript_6320/g.15747  ORF Transcript_6320/g.15747 Transcript_6320/m.15747 type:complete len:795 (-) Transcript_6320:146-2530(-)